MDTFKAENFSCDGCEKDVCSLTEEQWPVCKNTSQCWKWSMQKEDGSESHVHDDCIGVPQHMSLVCNNQPGEENVYHIECCEKKLCKNEPYYNLYSLYNRVNKIKPSYELNLTGCFDIDPTPPGECIVLYVLILIGVAIIGFFAWLCWLVHYDRRRVSDPKRVKKAFGSGEIDDELSSVALAEAIAEIEL